MHTHAHVCGCVCVCVCVCNGKYFYRRPGCDLGIKVRAVFIPIFDINSLKQTAVRDIE